MAGDYSRFSENVRKRFSELLMQQGRVQLDADWNELVDILTRRDRLQARDTFGPAAVPRELPHSFEITGAGAGDFTIGAGRMYVDGLLVEAFDDDKLHYLHQQFLDPAPALTGTQGLVYLDVWDREITAVEDPDLLEKALDGVDTGTRMKTIWQVKFVQQSAPSCATDFSALFPPSAGRLTVGVDQPPPPDDPCLLPDSAGFRDIENRLYRVEIHSVDAGTGAAKFKFSREGASIVSEIDLSGPVVPRQLTVRRIGRDSVLRFSQNDWVEITDDARLLAGLPGVMARIDQPPDESKLTVHLDHDIAGEITLTAANHPRLIRWDQQDLASRPLDTHGLIDVVLNTPISLERGVTVTFTLAPTTGRFHPLDYWLFPARVADASAGPLVKAPPRGIIHHYAALATITGIGTNIVATNCRQLWPPDVPDGDDCECSVCVTPEQQERNPNAIQNAIDSIKNTGGKVCLRPGTYAVTQPIQIRDATLIKLTGHGFCLLANTEGGAVIHVESSNAITIESLLFLGFATEARSSESFVEIGNCPGIVTVQECAFVIIDLSPSRNDSPRHGTGIELFGGLAALSVFRCAFSAGSGIRSAVFGKDTRAGQFQTFFCFDIKVRDCAFFCGNHGIFLEGFGFSTDVEDNLFTNSERAAVHITGFTRDSGTISITGNTIDAVELGNGIEVSIDNAQIVGNAVVHTGRAAGPARSSLGFVGGGIVVLPPPVENDIDACSVIGNRIAGVSGNGIWLLGRIASAMVKQNFIHDVGGGGIVTGPGGHIEHISIENNLIQRAGLLAGTDEAPLAVGISVGEGVSASIVANEIVDIGPADKPTQTAGIFALTVESVRVAGNTISGGRPVAGVPFGIGLGFFREAEVSGNSVRRQAPNQTGAGDTQLWLALLIFSGRFGRLTSDIRIVGGTAHIVRRESIRALAAAQTAGTTLVHGNVFETIGASPRTLVTISGEECTFTDNICTVSAAQDRGAESLVTIVAPALIVTSNRAAGGKVDLDLTSRSDPARWTVLGNVANRAILLNGSPLPAPWHDLNRSV